MGYDRPFPLRGVHDPSSLLPVCQLQPNELHPGGRASVTLFEAAPEDPRPHPRFRVRVPPATDPAPLTFDFSSVDPADGPGFAAWLKGEWEKAARGGDRRVFP